MNIPLSKRLIIRLCGQKKPCTDFDFRHINSILIRPLGDAVGDAVINLAYAKQLKTLYPDLKLGILVTGRNKNIFLNSPLIDETIDFKAANYFKHRKKWDLMLDFGETLDSRNIIANYILAPHAVMIFKKRARKYYSLNNIKNYDFHCPYDQGSHVVRHLHTSAFAQHFSIPEILPSLDLPQAEQTANSLWQTDNQTEIRVFIAPQGSVPFKCVPPEELAQLLNAYSPEMRARTRFIMCRAKTAVQYFAKLKPLCQTDIQLSLSPPTTLEEYMAMTASADIIVGVDSGTVHLACALRKPLLSFYVDHNIHTWGPLHHPHVPYFMAVSHSARADSPSEEISWQNRGDFPIAEAADWLNREVAALLREKQGDSGVKQ